MIKENGKHKIESDFFMEMGGGGHEHDQVWNTEILENFKIENFHGCCHPCFWNIFIVLFTWKLNHTQITHTHKPTRIHTHTHTHTNIVVYEYLKPFTFFTQNFLCILWVHFTILHESKECGEFFIIIDTHTQKHTHTH